MRRLYCLLLLFILPAALAQGRLNVPNYYLSQLPVLVDGEPLRGELTTDDGQNFKDGSYLDLYVMHGQEGEVVELTLSSLEFDTFLTIYSPDGSLLDWVDDGYYSADSEITLTLPATGRYLLVVTGYSSLDLGRYTLERATRGAPGTTEATAFDVPGTFEGSIEETVIVPYMELPGVALVFELTEPSALAFDLSSDAFDTYLMITDEAGNLIVENDDRNYSEATNYDTSSAAFAEFEPGVYYVYVTSWFGAPNGPFTLEAKRFVRAD